MSHLIHEFLEPGQHHRDLYGWARGCPLPREAILRIAAALVEGVCATLNTSKADPCESCGLKRADDWSELKSFRALQPLAKKLRTNAGLLEAAQEGEAQAPA